MISQPSITVPIYCTYHSSASHSLRSAATYDRLVEVSACRSATMCTLSISTASRHFTSLSPSGVTLLTKSDRGNHSERRSVNAILMAVAPSFTNRRPARYLTIIVRRSRGQVCKGSRSEYVSRCNSSSPRHPCLRAITRSKRHASSLMADKCLAASLALGFGGYHLPLRVLEHYIDFFDGSP